MGEDEKKFKTSKEKSEHTHMCEQCAGIEFMDFEFSRMKKEMKTKAAHRLCA